MKNFKTATAPGLFDVDFRLQWRLAKGNPWSRLDAVVDWELFRPLLDASLNKPVKGPGGRRPHDRLKMLQVLLVQRFDGLSDEQTEYQISDRLSFQQFIGWTLADKIPDANTLWDCRTRQRRLVGLGFREALIQTGAFEKLFALFDEPTTPKLSNQRENINNQRRCHDCQNTKNSTPTHTVVLKGSYRRFPHERT